MYSICNTYRCCSNCNPLIMSGKKYSINVSGDLEYLMKRISRIINIVCFRTTEKFLTQASYSQPYSEPLDLILQLQNKKTFLLLNPKLQEANKFGGK